jgi:hypothetical protein
MGSLRQLWRSTPLWDAFKRVAEYPDYWYWRLRGSPMRRVPHLLKQRTLKEYARRYNLRVMVETGTNMGQMIRSMLPLMDAIYSIEMEEWNYQRAKRKFAGDARVHMVKGESGATMPSVVKEISEPCLFWLDAHDFDKTTPIREELKAIVDHGVRGDVILVDDSKWFDGRNQYPTMEWMREFVSQNLAGYSLEDRMHMLRITPERKP